MENVSSLAASPIGVDYQLPRKVSEGHCAGYYITITIFLVAVWFFFPKKQTSHLEIPFYKASKTKWIFDAETLIKDSYTKFRDRVYQIKATEGVQVIVPARLVGELKGLPENILSATEAVSDALQSKYTKFSPGHNGELLALLVRTKLTQNLTRVVPLLKKELEHLLATEFPACEDWTPVKWQPFSLRAVARLSGRAFVGPSINRDEKWMDTSINFAVHVFTACVKLQFIPEWARPVGQHLVSELRQIRKDIKNAKEMLKPILEERLHDMEFSNGGDAPDDMIQWLIEALPEDEKADLTTQAELQLIIAAASIHTTNNLLCECLCDLAAYPEVQEELREEAYRVLEVDNGWENKESMAKLKKLDSFMREVQRLSGNITSFIRKVMKPISLSDGTELPVGTKVLAPQAGIALDERYFPDPERFDAFRFYKLRQESAEASNRWQFTSLNDTYINFGAGKHACPGRFFASNEIKLVLAHILINYDIRLKVGEDRPKAMAVVMAKAPSPDTELEFRRRSWAA
ncbi:cytochrome P450 monooxygenase (lovA) [Fusarium agapanthi]|uniref:Cytochrome P450 monooxygenase (LovA) n=1 Tax=Fusarium agapanthi TaxID=1803897 RepID=A0A9P5E9V8_9HYPO|nr:cytochrome P450 monooxygenase (lovA) [Fusarium agapanthi]